MERNRVVDLTFSATEGSDSKTSDSELYSGSDTETESGSHLDEGENGIDGKTTTEEEMYIRNGETDVSSNIQSKKQHKHFIPTIVIDEMTACPPNEDDDSYFATLQEQSLKAEKTLENLIHEQTSDGNIHSPETPSVEHFVEEEIRPLVVTDMQSSCTFSTHRASTDESCLHKVESYLNDESKKTEEKSLDMFVELPVNSVSHDDLSKVCDNIQESVISRTDDKTVATENVTTVAAPSPVKNKPQRPLSFVETGVKLEQAEKKFGSDPDVTTKLIGGKESGNFSHLDNSSTPLNGDSITSQELSSSLPNLAKTKDKENSPSSNNKNVVADSPTVMRMLRLKEKYLLGNSSSSEETQPTTTDAPAKLEPVVKSFLEVISEKQKMLFQSPSSPSSVTRITGLSICDLSPSSPTSTVSSTPDTPRFQMGSPSLWSRTPSSILFPSTLGSDSLSPSSLSCESELSNLPNVDHTPSTHISHANENDKVDTLTVNREDSSELPHEHPEPHDKVENAKTNITDDMFNSTSECATATTESITIHRDMNEVEAVVRTSPEISTENNLDTCETKLVQDNSLHHPSEVCPKSEEGLESKVLAEEEQDLTEVQARLEPFNETSLEQIAQIDNVNPDMEVSLTNVDFNDINVKESDTQNDVDEKLKANLTADLEPCLEPSLEEITNTCLSDITRCQDSLNLSADSTLFDNIDSRFITFRDKTRDNDFDFSGDSLYPLDSTGVALDSEENYPLSDTSLTKEKVILSDEKTPEEMPQIVNVDAASDVSDVNEPVLQTDKTDRDVLEELSKSSKEPVRDTTNDSIDFSSLHDQEDIAKSDDELMEMLSSHTSSDSDTTPSLDESIYNNPEPNLVSSSKFEKYVSRVAEHSFPFGGVRDSIDVRRSAISKKSGSALACLKQEGHHVHNRVVEETATGSAGAALTSNDDSVTNSKDDNNKNVMAATKTTDEIPFVDDESSQESSEREAKIKQSAASQVPFKRPPLLRPSSMIETSPTPSSFLMSIKKNALLDTPLSRGHMETHVTPKTVGEAVEDLRQLKSVEREMARQQARERARLKSDEELGLNNISYSNLRKKYQKTDGGAAIDIQEENRSREVSLSADASEEQVPPSPSLDSEEVSLPADESENEFPFSPPLVPPSPPCPRTPPSPPSPRASPPPPPPPRISPSPPLPPPRIPPSPPPRTSPSPPLPPPRTPPPPPPSSLSYPVMQSEEGKSNSISGDYVEDSARTSIQSSEKVMDDIVSDSSSPDSEVFEACSPFGSPAAPEQATGWSTPDSGDQVLKSESACSVTTTSFYEGDKKDGSPVTSGSASSPSKTDCASYLEPELSIEAVDIKIAADSITDSVKDSNNQGHSGSVKVKSTSLPGIMMLRKDRFKSQKSESGGNPDKLEKPKSKEKRTLLSIFSAFGKSDVSKSKSKDKEEKDRRKEKSLSLSSSANVEMEVCQVQPMPLSPLEGANLKVDGTPKESRFPKLRLARSKEKAKEKRKQKYLVDTQKQDCDSQLTKDIVALPQKNENIVIASEVGLTPESASVVLASSSPTAEVTVSPLHLSHKKVKKSAEITLDRNALIASMSSISKQIPPAAKVGNGVAPQASG